MTRAEQLRACADKIRKCAEGKCTECRLNGAGNCWRSLLASAVKQLEHEAEQREKALAVKRKIRERHAEEYNAYCREYSKRHREQMNKNCKRWRDANPEKVKQYQKAYRERRLAEDPEWLKRKNHADYLRQKAKRQGEDERRNGVERQG